MAIVAINQQLGSRGRELGRLLAERLNYRFVVSEDIIALTVERYRVPAEELRIIDERYLRFWERLKTDMVRLFGYMRAVALLEMAKDRIVIVGKSFALMVPMDVENALRIRTVAPFHRRVEQIALEEKLERSAAQRRVYNSDREERARIQALLSHDPEDPSLYHLVINTAALSLDRLVDMLAASVEACDRASEPLALERIKDSALAAQVRAALLSNPHFGNAPVRVKATKGIVTLSGECLVPPWDRIAVEVASAIEGVQGVELETPEPKPLERPV